MVVVSGSDEEPEEGNVLVPEVIQALYRQQKSIENDILTKYGQTWSDVCIKLPVVKAPDISKILFGKKRRRRRRNALHPELMHLTDHLEVSQSVHVQFAHDICVV